MELIKDAVRNLSRRYMRTVLAVMGIAAGVFSFLLMQAMSLHFASIGRQFSTLFENRIFVVEKPTFWAGGGILSQAKAEKTSRVPGVRQAVPVLVNRLGTSMMITVGVPRVVIGVPPESLHVVAGDFPLKYGEKDLVRIPGALVGFDAAEELDARINDTVTIEGEKIRVNGIYGKTGTLIDGQIFLPLEQAQTLYHRKGIITGVFVVPEPDVNPETLAESIKTEVDGVEVIPPSKFKKQVETSLSLWNTITLGASLAATIAGILCVIVVMLSAVFERIVEIGIKKALGAETKHILLEFLAESLIISLAGWLLACMGASLFSHFAGNWLKQYGANIFEMNLHLFAKAFLATILVGTLAGIYPALKAASIKPVDALKVRY